MVAIFVLIIAILFWGAASEITPHDCDRWPDSCGDNYLPWPIEPKGFCSMATSQMDVIDKLFCNLVKTKLYVLLVILQIAATAWLGRLAVHRMARTSMLSKSDEKQQ
jgi:hypothetical protein